MTSRRLCCAQRSRDPAGSTAGSMRARVARPSAAACTFFPLAASCHVHSRHRFERRPGRPAGPGQAAGARVGRRVRAGPTVREYPRSSSSTSTARSSPAPTISSCDASANSCRAASAAASARSPAPRRCSTPARRQVIVSSALFTRRPGRPRVRPRARRRVGRDARIAAVDSFGGKVVIRGWTEATACTAVEAVRSLAPVLRRVPLHPRRHRGADARHRHGGGDAPCATRPTCR